MIEVIRLLLFFAELLFVCQELDACLQNILLLPLPLQHGFSWRHRCLLKRALLLVEEVWIVVLAELVDVLNG